MKGVGPTSMYPEPNILLKLTACALEQKKQYDGHTFDDEKCYLVIHDTNALYFGYSKREKHRVPAYHFGSRKEATIFSYRDAEKWRKLLSRIQFEWDVLSFDQLEQQIMQHN